MSPHNHDAVPTYRTAHSPGYGAYADVENCSTTAGGRMHLTKLLHASGTLLPSFFRRFTLLSARHSNILHDLANHYGSCSSAHAHTHATATSRASDPVNPAPPRALRDCGMAHRAELVLQFVEHLRRLAGGGGGGAGGGTV
ncbi:hypothetical protein JB92DRAFT_3134824 [Gautieria morchelliformis]|nr:hypothetical protein JB92DRAFT_3134824 [Gautieria morchelliformis]